MTLNGINDTMDETPLKLLLVVCATNEWNAETRQLLRTLIEEALASDWNYNNAVEQVLQTISSNFAEISTAIKEVFQ